MATKTPWEGINPEDYPHLDFGKRLENPHHAPVFLRGRQANDQGKPPAPIKPQQARGSFAEINRVGVS